MPSSVKIWLVRFATLGPLAYFVADRLGHAFGICLGQ
jgi:hypothetical protein